jgi:hypothetical protein
MEVRMSRKIMIVTVVTIALATGLTPAGDALALSPHVRDGWVLGLSYGGARGKATGGSGTAGESGETEDGVSPQIRFGHMVGGRFSLGASYAGWMYETGTTPIKYRYAMQTILLAASWYPGRPDNAWGGLVVRGGAGLGWANFTEVELVAGEEQGHGDRTTETGFGWELNIGYEWRLVRDVSAGIGFGVNHLDIGKTLTEKATFYPVTLNLGWYWD